VAVSTDLAREVLPPLAGFVGNAGVQFSQSTRSTVDEIEETFVNVLASYMLMNQLREYFRPPARIVLTTSGTHFGDFSHNLRLAPTLRGTSRGHKDPQTAYSTSNSASSTSFKPWLGDFHRR